MTTMRERLANLAARDLWDVPFSRSLSADQLKDGEALIERLMSELRSPDNHMINSISADLGGAVSHRDITDVILCAADHISNNGIVIK